MAYLRLPHLLLPLSRPDQDIKMINFASKLEIRNTVVKLTLVHGACFGEECFIIILSGIAPKSLKQVQDIHV